MEKKSNTCAHIRHRLHDPGNWKEKIIRLENVIFKGLFKVSKAKTIERIYYSKEQLH